METTEAKAVPYYTTDDESKWCGHIFRARQGNSPSGRRGYQFCVYPPYSTGNPSDAEVTGWRPTQDSAERAMNEALARKDDQ